MMHTIINNSIKKKIEQLYLGTPNNIHGVGFGLKSINGGYTDIDSIIFTVDHKKPRSELSSSEIIPKNIVIDGKIYATDVVESQRLIALSCFVDTDPDVARLQPARSGYSSLMPFRGGQEIMPFPYGWASVSTPYSVGTLGGFVIDDTDSKIVGITNAHVAIYDDRLLIASDRDLLKESSDTYNTLEEQPFFVFGNQNPGAITLYDTDNDSLLEYFLVSKYIKRYQPLYLNSINYVDCALLVMNPNVLDENSYKMWTPIGTPENSSFLPFASTEEIDSLFSINTFLYSTGSTTGPKGYDGSASCRLVVDQVGFSASIAYGDIILDFSDLITYRYQDQSGSPAMGGDSGSLVLAYISGGLKIIGLTFAGGIDMAAMCRIDRVATSMNIRAWDSSVNVVTDSVIPDPSCVVIDTNDPRVGQQSITHNGKVYYQSGFTKNSNCENITNI